jgi:CheY-like chemotaxis protein
VTMNGPEHFVVVDDEEDLLHSLASALARARPVAEVRAFADPVRAADHLERTPRVDALITDIRMPKLDGIELLLRARRRRPGLPAVVMTAFSSPSLVSQVSSFGTVEYLDKPFSVAAFTAAIDRVLTVAAAGFAGALAIEGLPDLIQLCAFSSTTSALRIAHGEGEGAIWFERGLVVHAERGELEGLGAFFDILSWKGGEFSVERGAVARKRSIVQKATELLIEGLRLQDEATRRDHPAVPSAGGELDLELALDEFELDDSPGTVESPQRASDPDPGNSSPGPLAAVSVSRQEAKENVMGINVQNNLERLRTVDGYIGSCLVDSESGMTLGVDGGGVALNLEIAAAGNTEVVRAKRKAMKALGLKDEIEDILISLGKQYHIIRPLRGRPGIFYYVAVDRTRANLAMARMSIAETEKELVL